MTRIAIVEDEAAVREQLAGYVQRYTRQYGTPFEVTEFTDGMEILEDYRPQFDIIFLDVEMKHLDGMETARRIRERDGGVLIVFITNMAQYAIKGYSVGALDYVLKPVPYFAFSQQLQKALGQLEKRERHYLAVAVDGGMRRLDAAEIYYLESEGHKVHFYTEKEDFVVPGTLKNYEEKLVGRAFARCNSGYLVNLAQVSGVQQDMVRRVVPQQQPAHQGRPVGRQQPADLFMDDLRGRSGEFVVGQRGEVDDRHVHGERRAHHLHWHAAFRLERRAEDLMPRDDIGKRGVQHRAVQRAANVQRSLGLVSQVARRDLLQEPDALLREGQRHRRGAGRAVQGRHRRRPVPVLADLLRADVGRQAGGSGAAVDAGQRHLYREGLAHPRCQTAH